MEYTRKELWDMGPLMALDAMLKDDHKTIPDKDPAVDVRVAFEEGLALKKILSNSPPSEIEIQETGAIATVNLLTSFGYISEEDRRDLVEIITKAKEIPLEKRELKVQ